MKALICRFVKDSMKKLFPKINLSIRDWAALIICSVPAFYLLGTPAIYIWDEAVYANASLDMANGTSWLVPVQEDYNTKPPLVLWLQALFLLIIPSAEWAIRLPSALSVVGILWLLQVGLKRWGFDFWSRLLVMVCFVGHEGFIRHHIGRTGDLDAVMTFFVTAYCIIVLDALHFKRWSNKYMIFFFLAFIAAFYAKSIAGWMMMAPLGLVWLLSPMRKVLLQPRFIMGVALSLLTCLLYYLLREQAQPGYLALTWESEYMRIAKNVMPWHEHPASYYFTNFILLKTFTPWVFLLVGAIVYSLLLLKDIQIRKHVLLWSILGLGYMLIITFPAVKLEWYDAPAYPFFALITGVVIGHIASFVPARWQIILLLPVILVLGRKLAFIQQDIYPRHPFEHEGAMLRQATVSENTKVFMQVETHEHQLQLDFYCKIQQQKSSLLIQVIHSSDDVETGDEIIISQSAHLNEIQQAFIIDTLRQWDNLGYTILVKERR